MCCSGKNPQRLASHLSGGMVLGQPGGASRNLVPKGSVRNMLVPQPPAAAKPRGRIPGGRGAELDRAGAGASPRGDEEVDLGNEFLDFPLLDTLSKINAQVGGLRNQLAKTDHHVTAALLPPDEDDEEAVAQPQVARQDTAQSIEPDGTFLTGVDFVEKVRTPGEVDEAMRKELIEAKSVEALPWPGVGKQPHDLPGNLNSLDVLKRLGDMVQFPRKQDQRMWEELLGSKQSEAMTKVPCLSDLYHAPCTRLRAGSLSARLETLLPSFLPCLLPCFLASLLEWLFRCG